MLSAPDTPLSRSEEEAFTRPTFEVLYAVARAYLPEALRFARVPPEDVDDIVHDAVLVAHQGLHRYAPRAGPNGEPPDSRRSLKAWLSAIAWRLAARRRGRAYRRLELPHGDTADLAGSLEEAATSEQLAAAEQRRRILAAVVHKLRPERAEVLLMHTFLDMSVPDIAEELGVNPNTVKSRIARARADAIAAVKRLSRDEQSVLEGSPLMLPVEMGETPIPPARPVSMGEPPRPPPVSGLAAGAAGVLALGMALGAGVYRHRALPAERAPIAAIADPVDARPPGDPQPLRAVPPEAPAAAATASAPPRLPAPPPRASGLESRSLARELVWITAARRALQAGAGERALSALKSHENEFPRGVLARERELLKERARALGP